VQALAPWLLLSLSGASMPSVKARAKMKIGFIGLGKMGREIALNLQKAGFELAVFNRTQSATEEFQKLGCKAAASVEELARWAEVVITMLANDQAVEAVILGNESSKGVFGERKNDQLHISMSTISVRLSQQLEELHKEANQHYIAAPVVGRPEAAAAKKLWVMAAGAPDQVQSCATIFDAIGQGTFVMGDRPYLANVAKLANNFLIASFIESISQALSFVEKSHLDREKFVELITSALLRSPIYENYAKRVLDGAFRPSESGFGMELALKDINLVLEAAGSTQTPMPLASLLHDRMLSGIARGYAEFDWTATALIARSDAGLPVDF
jgi:3-hydroxyisobutyrate dehydrogenase-like beta-hydroxyacid dehydrogenase